MATPKSHKSPKLRRTSLRGLKPAVFICKKPKLSSASVFAGKLQSMSARFAELQKLPVLRNMGSSRMRDTGGFTIWTCGESVSGKEFPMVARRLISWAKRNSPPTYLESPKPKKKSGPMAFTAKSRLRESLKMLVERLGAPSLRSAVGSLKICRLQRILGRCRKG